MGPDTLPAAMLRGISSMATRRLLAELAQDWAAQGQGGVAFESVGGVLAAQRVAAGEPFDLVVLAADAIDALIAGGSVRAGSRVDLARSGIFAAVPAGVPPPDFSSPAAVRAAVLAAPSIGYSTGPSGTALTQLFARWGIAEAVAPRMVQTPPGVPVGRWVGEGRIALGFQQGAELVHEPGLTVVGPLPPAIQIETVFAAGVCSASIQPAAAQALQRFLAGPACAAAKQRQGMVPA